MGDDFGEMLDTAPAQRARYYALLRALTPEQRARKAAGLSRAVRSLAEADLRARHPGASARDRARMLAERLYGADLAARLPR